MEQFKININSGKYGNFNSKLKISLEDAVQEWIDENRSKPVECDNNGFIAEHEKYRMCREVECIGNNYNTKLKVWFGEHNSILITQ